MIGLSGEIPLVSHSDVTSPFPPSGNGGYASNLDVPFVMGTLFNPAMREATGSLYKLHTREIEYTSFPPIAVLIGWARSLLVEISQ